MTNLMKATTPAVTATVGTSTGVTAYAQKGTNVIITNTGVNPAFITIGNVNSTASATANICIPPNYAQVSLEISSADTHIAHISTGGATTLNVAAGVGI